LQLLITLLETAVVVAFNQGVAVKIRRFVASFNQLKTARNGQLP
jgi:hypothetical protein